MDRVFSMAFGIISYIVFFGTFLYAIGFVGNVAVPKSIDSGTEGPLLASLLIDTVLLGIFGIQHSVMARPGFKRVWTRIVPKHLERSIYVLLASLALILVFWQWRPALGIVWSVDDTVGRFLLHGVFVTGWLIVLASTFMINHFDLFGLRQVYLHGRESETGDLGFTTRALYKYVRHPIMLGFIIAFWATPHMTTGHLLFAIVTTLYILVAVQFEERDLAAHYGEEYRQYRSQVGMLVPIRSAPPTGCPVHNGVTSNKG